MADIHLFGGEKGGVGKSFVCRTAVQYHLDRGIEFALYDADRCNADVNRIYSEVGCQKIILSENRKHQDEGIPAYLDAIDKPTLINLPAQIIDSFQNWFEKNDLSEMAKEDEIEIYLWFVCNGQTDSIALLSEYFSRFKSKVKYVLVKNQGVCEDWQSLDINEHVQKKISKFKVTVINFPELYGDNTVDKIDKESLTFGQAKSDSNISLFDRRRVSTFLKKAYEVFDSSEVFKQDDSKLKSDKNGKKGFSKVAEASNAS